MAYTCIHTFIPISFCVCGKRDTQREKQKDRERRKEFIYVFLFICKSSSLSQCIILWLPVRLNGAVKTCEQQLRRRRRGAKWQAIWLTDWLTDWLHLSICSSILYHQCFHQSTSRPNKSAVNCFFLASFFIPFNIYLFLFFLLFLLPRIFLSTLGWNECHGKKIKIGTLIWQGN